MAERNLKKEIQEKLQDDIMQGALSKFAGSIQALV